MNIDHTIDLRISQKPLSCATLLLCCIVLVLTGCGGGDGDGGDGIGSSGADNDAPTASQANTPNPVFETAGGEREKTAEAQDEPKKNTAVDHENVGSEDSATGLAEAQTSEPVPDAIETPTPRPRVESPIDKLPPPEAEMTPPPPRTSIAAAEIASRKSEEAGKAYMAFVEAETTAERIQFIRGGEALQDKVEKYHTNHVQSDFKITETQIMGSGRRLDDPTKFVFPYYVATTKNPFGFLVLVYEEDDGMKVSWEQFVLGQDYPMHDFLLRKDTDSYEFLGAITRAHIFDPDISEADKAKLLAVNIDLPRVALADKPIAYVDSASPIGTQLAEALPWGKRQLSRIGLQHDATGKLRITSYAKLAHPN